MRTLDKLLQDKGLKFEDLNPDEKEIYFSWNEALSKSKISVDSVRDFITQSRYAIELELTESKDKPQSWISLLTLFIPIVGIIRKFYQDRRESELKARLRNYILIENMLTSPERAEKMIKKQISNIKLDNK